MTGDSGEKPWLASLRWAAAATICVAAFAAFLVALKDPDVFYFLAFGRELFRHGFPATEPFLYPHAGSDTSVASWVNALLVYGSHQLLGASGPILLGALLGALCFAVMARDASWNARSPLALAAALAPIALAIAVHRPRASARPEALAFLCLALTLAALNRLEGGKARVAVLPLVFLLWANAHQSMGAGLAVLGLALAVWHLQRRVAPDSAPAAPQLRLLALWGLAAGGAGLLNPAGAEQLRIMVRFAGSSLFPGQATEQARLLRTMISELGPIPREDWLGPFGALVLVTAIALAAGFNRETPRQLATAAATLAVAVSAWRYESLAAVVLAPIAGRHLAVAASRLEGRLRLGVALLALPATGLFAAAAAWGAAEPTARFGLAFEPWGFPIRPAQFLQSIGFRGRIFNTFHFGGYLEWTLDQPVFQDGRGWLKPEDAAPALMETGHYAQFARLDERYRFDALVIARPNLTGELSAFAMRTPYSDIAAPRETWALVAFDDASLLYLRRGGPWSATIERSEFRYLLPANPVPNPGLELPPRTQGLMGDLLRAVAESPQCRRCRAQLALAFRDLGQFDAALKVLEPVREGAPPDLQTSVLLATADVAWGAGDRATARRAANAALELGLGHLVARRFLAAMAWEEGRGAEAEALVRRNLADEPTSLTDQQLLTRFASPRQGAR